MKYFFCDLETTGVNPISNGITEIGMILISGKKREEHQFFIRPFENDQVNARALEVQQRTQAEIEEFEDPYNIHRKLTAILSRFVNKYDRTDKFFFVGYNAGFDYDFLRSFFNKCGDKFFGSFVFYPPLDVMGMAALHLMKERSKMVNFKLLTVANECGIHMEEESAHGALYDIQKTEELFWKLNPHLKG